MTKPALAGRLDVSWTINTEGRPEGITFVEDTLGDEALRQCVARVLGQAQFPTSCAGKTVNVPFDLKTD